MKSKYKIGHAKHSYGCHPETCNCAGYAIIKEDGTVISKHYSYREAEKLIKELNNE